jgi:hypothetical protein
MCSKFDNIIFVCECKYKKLSGLDSLFSPKGSSDRDNTGFIIIISLKLNYSRHDIAGKLLCWRLNNNHSLMVNNCTNINKTNNYLSSQTIKHKNNFSPKGSSDRGLE